MYPIKKSIKLTLCRILFYGGFVPLYIKFLKNRLKHFPVVIINYHSFVENLDNAMETVPSVTKRIDDFKKEVKFLKRHFDVVSLDRLAETLSSRQLFNKPTVAITIDDGYRDNFDLLFPILKKEKIPVTIFLAAGFIGTSEKIWVSHVAELFLHTPQKNLVTSGVLGEKNYSLRSMKEKRFAYDQILQKLKDMNIDQRNHWLNFLEEQLGKYVRAEPLMLNWNQVREMVKNGVSVGAHSCTHPILTSISLEAARQEIGKSKAIIERELGIPIRHFAFPNGRPQDFSEALRQFCKEIGFDSVSTCSYGHNGTAEDLWSLKRIGSEIPISLFAINILRAFQYDEMGDTFSIDYKVSKLKF